MPPRWPQQGPTHRVFQTPIFGIDSEHLVSRRSGQAHEFFLLDCADWCNIVALTPDEQVVMVRQFRYGRAEETLELPGGMVDSTDPSPLEAARRELLEETGFVADQLTETGIIAPNPAMQRNRTWSFLARNVRAVAGTHQDDGEDIEVVLVPYQEIPARVAKGEISHALVVVAFAFALGLRGPA